MVTEPGRRHLDWVTRVSITSGGTGHHDVSRDARHREKPRIFAMEPLLGGHSLRLDVREHCTDPGWWTSTE